MCITMVMGILTDARQGYQQQLPVPYLLRTASGVLQSWQIWKDKLPAICLGKSLHLHGPEKKASDSLDMAVWALLAKVRYLPLP